METFNYTTKNGIEGEMEIVMFLVVATEPIGGFRAPYLKTFDQAEALTEAFSLEAEWGPGANVKIEECGISKQRWEYKFKTSWPLSGA